MSDSGTSVADFGELFARATGGTSVLAPHPWQAELARDKECTDRLIRIPTGFGKTFGVLGAWLWHRVVRADAAWPRRLVWCLPMRVLVEQVADEVRGALERTGVLWDGAGDHAGKVGVHLLMGGADGGEWVLHPEHAAVLIGTQDMLLSRALNRGYGAPRARWPMEFGLLHQDCLWVMDEVQLMDVGLATSGQLQAFRAQDALAGKLLRPCRTWWMSATLQPAWLRGTPETAQLGPALEAGQTRIAPAQRVGPLCDDVEKPCRVSVADDFAALAGRVAAAHLAHGRGAGGPTLVVLNTVEGAVQVHAQLARNRELAGTDLRVVHSRFRGAERAGWRAAFLNRDACTPGMDRIIVATQVIEAGVDISAALLFTQLAPWASLVQRFGRAARWGGSAQVEVVDFQPSNDKAALPYALDALAAARQALALLQGVAPRDLEAFEQQHPQLLSRLYPYTPRHVLLRHELDELFDTTPDLTGADVDVSRFIRSGEERDLQVFWADVAQGAEPDRTLRPAREALCSVPFLAARDWLCGKETARRKAPRLLAGKRAWVWSYLDGGWKLAQRQDLYPGQTVLVDASCGGYAPAVGWNAASTAPVLPVPGAVPDAQELADATEDDESLSAAAAWQTIAVHGAQVGSEASAAARRTGLDHAALLNLAGRWHDAGKALAPFQASMTGANRPARRDLAKAPKSAWLPPHQLYPDGNGPRRAGLRHELASTLALFAVLMRHQPDHRALLGPWRGLLETAGMPPLAAAPAAAAPNALEQEILALDADAFDLIAYLVCSHHGKVRTAWHASPADQRAAGQGLRIRGVRDGETLPALTLASAQGDYLDLPPSELRLDAAAAGLNPRTGRGWTERVLGLLDRHGPFALAYLEALLRAADQRASRAPVADPLLQTENAPHGLETGNHPLARAEPAGTGMASLAAHPPPRGAEHGLRGRTGEPGDAGSGTRAPAAATRHIQTAHGVLSYAELAPLLARQVAQVERAIASGEYDGRPLDEALIHDLHTRICADLVPHLAGWRRHDVQVGQHTPPSFITVPGAMRDYARDVSARLAGAAAAPHHLPESTVAL